MPYFFVLVALLGFHRKGAGTHFRVSGFEPPAVNSVKKNVWGEGLGGHRSAGCSVPVQGVSNTFLGQRSGEFSFLEASRDNYEL